MQFLSGGTLASRIRRGPMPTSRASPLVEDMTAALSAAHQAEVIHRDFKSGNVMLVNGPSCVFAVVTDFGLARQLHDRVCLPNRDGWHCKLHGAGANQRGGAYSGDGHLCARRGDV